MTDPVIDTLDYCETLEKSQVPHYQAVAHARGLNEALVAATAGLATKADLREMKSDIIVWIVSMFLALVIIIVTAVVGIVPMISK